MRRRRHLALDLAHARLDLGVAVGSTALRLGLPACVILSDEYEPPPLQAVVGGGEREQREADLPQQTAAAGATPAAAATSGGIHARRGLSSSTPCTMLIGDDADAP